MDTKTGYGPTMVGEWGQADTDCTPYVNNVRFLKIYFCPTLLFFLLWKCCFCLERELCFTNTVQS